MANRGNIGLYLDSIEGSNVNGRGNYSRVKACLSAAAYMRCGEGHRMAGKDCKMVSVRLMRIDIRIMVVPRAGQPVGSGRWVR
jgi:hypothetical protein